VSITPASKFETDAVTVGDRRVSIKTTPTGYYRIDVEGSGSRPKMCDEIFTNLRAARIAISKYLTDNAATLNKKKMIKEVAERHKIKPEDAQS
jgi:hypothetical protein